MSNWMEISGWLYNIDSFRKIDVVPVNEDRDSWALRAYYTLHRPGMYDEYGQMDEYCEYEDIDFGTKDVMTGLLKRIKDILRAPEIS